MSIYKPSLLDKFKDFVNGLKGNWNQYEAHVADFEAHLAESALWIRIDNLSAPLEITSTDYQNPNVVPLKEPYATRIYAAEFGTYADSRSSQFSIFRGSDGGSAGGLLAVVEGDTILTVQKIKVQNNYAIGFYSKSGINPSRALYVKSVYLVK